MSNIIKHIDLFEGVTDSFYMRVYCKNRTESVGFEDTLHKNGFTWKSGNRYLIRNGYDINDVTFYDFDIKDKTFSARKKKETGKDVIGYTENKFNLVNRILNNIPNYKPRKIDKTLESVSDTRYRFKTKKEFIKEYGLDFHRRVSWSPSGGMDFLFGTELSVDFEDFHNNYYRVKIPEGWVINNRMLVKLPTPPSYKPRKFDRTLESLNESVDFNPMDSFYFKKYNAFIMVFDKDVNSGRYNRMATALKEIFNFGSAFDVNVIGYRQHCTDNKFIYFVRKYPGGLGWGWDLMRDFDSSVDATDTYPKLFTIDEVDSKEKIMSLLNYGTIIPSYRPRRIDRTIESVNEGFDFITTEQRLKSCPTKPKFSFGEKIILKKNGINIHLDRINGRYNEHDNVIEWMKKQLGHTLIATSFVNDPDWNDLWIVDCRNEKGESNYIQQDALMSYTPNYYPRKIDRTVESVDNKYNYDVHKSYYFKKYNTFIVVFNKYMELDVFHNVINMLSEVFDDSLRTKFDLLELIVEIPNNEDEYYVSFFYDEKSGKWYNGWCNLGYLSSDVKLHSYKKFPRAFKYKSVDTWDKLKYILDSGDMAPSYKPRKMNRTTESTDNKHYIKRYGK